MIFGKDRSIDVDWDTIYEILDGIKAINEKLDKVLEKNEIKPIARTNKVECGADLRRLRLGKGWTAEKLAKHIGCANKQSIYDYEREICKPKGKTAVLLAETLDFDLGDYLMK